MRNFYKLLILATALFTIASCKDDDEKTFCADILIPMVVNLNYVDNTGKDLLFGDAPLYPAENIKIYTQLNGEQKPLPFTVNKNSKFITINLIQSKHAEFLIELKAGMKDKVSIEAKIDEKDPCKNFKVMSVDQNDTPVQLNQENRVWIFKK